MIETIITSSVLILIIAALRYLLRGKVSSRLQYALWMLVAIRLLLPFSLFESPASVMNAVPAVQSFSAASRSAVPANDRNTVLPSEASPALQNSSAVSYSSDGRADTVDGKAIAQYVWLCGVILSGAFFAASNIHFRRKLKQNKKQVEISQCPLPVYMASGIPSPCLYGIVNPAIYVTPESLSHEKRKGYVIAHELTHYRQKDHIWSFVRVLCLCIHWFNPLVLLAAVLSRRDSELACDEGTLRRIGFENRVEYGKTLIEMMTSPSKPSDIFCCATTMAGGKREMTERIKRIARQPKMLMITLAAVVVVAVAAVAFTFGSAAGKIPAALPQSSEVRSITIERINDGENLGEVRVSQKADVESILGALADTDKTLRESVNDAPYKDSYFRIDINGAEYRRFYLYSDGGKYYVEEPYAGIYRINHEVNGAVEKIYAANGGVDLSINIQELWDARTLYVGDNSAVGKLLGLLPLPKGLLHDHFALHTTGTERGVEWILKEDTRSSYDIQQFDQNALLLFALIDNMEDFYVTIGNPPDAGTELHYVRSWADEFVGGDVRDYSESQDKLRELTGFTVTKTPSYSMAKLEKGEIISEHLLENQEIADAVIMDALVKSAAWEGVDITTLKECYLIRQTFPIVNETHDYYAYLLEDGRAVLQSGTDGWYTMLSRELYSELVELWDNLTADTWLENQYTEGVPQPDFDNLLWMAPDEEKGYCAVCYQDVDPEQMEAYLQMLVNDGWQTVHDFYEDTTAGGFYEKDGRAISIQSAGEQVVMYFSIK